MWYSPKQFNTCLVRNSYCPSSDGPVEAAHVTQRRILRKLFQMYAFVCHFKFKTLEVSLGALLLSEKYLVLI